jgi:putative tryptophan/tyrosine transport system substrate-binding protein
MMDRRAFIGCVAGSIIAVPLAARAQQPAMPVIGFLGSASPNARSVAAFRQGLSEAGLVEGQNVAIEYRWAEESFDRFPEFAAELVRRRVRVIAAPGSTTAALAAKAATGTIPIVFGVSEDPVKLGLVASLARPGGNATGINYFTAEIVAKRLGLLHELLPRAARVAVLLNPANVTNTQRTLQEVEAAARAMALQIQTFNASTISEIDSSFAALARWQPDAVFVAPDSFYNTRREQLSKLAAHHAIPAVYAVRNYVEAGGLMSYGPNIAAMFHKVGAYTGKILNGKKPEDLPVEQVAKFELVINLKTAKTLGLTIPPSLLLRADDVIQ